MSKGRTLAVLLGSTVLLTLAATGSGAADADPGRSVLTLRLSGVVDPFMASYVKGGIDRAEADGDAAVLLSIDTPGGLLSSMREITQAILSSRVPVMCWTGPAGTRAASAGTFIMFACPVSAMAPATNIGAAHPVGVSGAIEQTKVTNDAVASIRSLAERWGRNADWAEQAVRDSVSISAEEAVRIHVTDFVAASEAAVLAAADGRTVQLSGGSVTLRTSGDALVPIRMGFFASLLHGLITPDLAFLFFWGGLILIVIELLHPGLSVPGIVGTLMLVSSFTSFGFLPIRLAGVVLLIASAVFFLLEFKHPGLGLPTVGGAVTLVAGGALLFDSSVPNAQVSPWLIGIVAVVAVAFFAVVIKAALAARHRPVAVGEEDLVGAEGVALEELAPRGTVRVRRETWTADAVGFPIVAGMPVRVVEVVGVRLRVVPAGSQLPQQGPLAGHAAVAPEGGSR